MLSKKYECVWFDVKKKNETWMTVAASLHNKKYEHEQNIVGRKNVRKNYYRHFLKKMQIIYMS